MTLLIASLLFFLAAALGGIVLARGHLSRKRLPALLVVGHPLLAASGLILLGGSHVRAGGSQLLTAALIVLTLAALGGIGIATLRVKRGAAPGLLIGLHALLALSGVTLLVLELLAGEPRVPAAF